MDRCYICGCLMATDDAEELWRSEGAVKDPDRSRTIYTCDDRCQAELLRRLRQLKINVSRVVGN